MNKKATASIYQETAEQGLARCFTRIDTSEQCIRISEVLMMRWFHNDLRMIFCADDLDWLHLWIMARQRTMWRPIEVTESQRRMRGCTCSGKNQKSKPVFHSNPKPILCRIFKIDLLWFFCAAHAGTKESCAGCALSLNAIFELNN